MLVISDWRASCSGKKAYEGACAADHAIRSLLRDRRRKPEHGQRLVRYRCRYCHQWHVGNMQKPLDTHERSIRAIIQTDLQD